MEGSDSALDEVALGRVRAICQEFAGADECELQKRPLFRVGRTNRQEEVSDPRV